MFTVWSHLTNPGSVLQLFRVESLQCCSWWKHWGKKSSFSNTNKSMTTMSFHFYLMHVCFWIYNKQHNGVGGSLRVWDAWHLAYFISSSHGCVILVVLLTLPGENVDLLSQTSLKKKKIGAPSMSCLLCHSAADSAWPARSPTLEPEESSCCLRFCRSAMEILQRQKVHVLTKHFKNNIVISIVL